MYDSNPQYTPPPVYATPMQQPQNVPQTIYAPPAYPAPAPAQMPYPGQQQQQQYPGQQQQPYPGQQYVAPTTTVVNNYPGQPPSVVQNYPVMIEPPMPQQTPIVFNKPPGARALSCPLPGVSSVSIGADFAEGVVDLENAYGQGGEDWPGGQAENHHQQLRRLAAGTRLPSAAPSLPPLRTPSLPHSFFIPPHSLTPSLPHSFFIPPHSLTPSHPHTLPLPPPCRSTPWP